MSVSSRTPYVCPASDCGMRVFDPYAMLVHIRRCFDRGADIMCANPACMETFSSCSGSVTVKSLESTHQCHRNAVLEDHPRGPWGFATALSVVIPILDRRRASASASGTGTALSTPSSFSVDSNYSTSESDSYYSSSSSSSGGDEHKT